MNQNPRVTSNVTATLDDEYCQVFGLERPGRVCCVGRGPTPSKLVRWCSTASRADIENSEIVNESSTQVKASLLQVQGLTTFITNILSSSSGELVIIYTNNL